MGVIGHGLPCKFMQTNDIPMAFEQQPKESNKAFAAFCIYLNMGEERSTLAVARRLSRSHQLMRRWSARWDWMERVRAYAAHLARVEREATEALVRGRAAQWLERQEELREAEWQTRRRSVEEASSATASGSRVRRRSQE